MTRTGLCLNQGILISAFSLFVGCASQDLKGTEALPFHAGLTDESQILKSMARFCDSGDVALNSSEEIDPTRVMTLYDEFRASEISELSTHPEAVSELVKASLISHTSTEKLVEMYKNARKTFGESESPLRVAELVKISVVFEESLSKMKSDITKINAWKKWEKQDAVWILAKLHWVTDQPLANVFDMYDAIALRQGKAGKEKEIALLTQTSILFGKTANETVRLFDEVESMDKGWLKRDQNTALIRVAFMTNRSIKNTYNHFTEIGSKRKSMSYDEKMSLLEYTLFNHTNADTAIKLRDRLSKMEGLAQDKHTKGVLRSLVIAETLQEATTGADVDECSGGHARLMMALESADYE